MSADTGLPRRAPGQHLHPELRRDGPAVQAGWIVPVEPIWPARDLDAALRHHTGETTQLREQR